MCTVKNESPAGSGLTSSFQSGVFGLNHIHQSVINTFETTNAKRNFEIHLLSRDAAS